MILFLFDINDSLCNNTDKIDYQVLDKLMVLKNVLLLREINADFAIIGKDNYSKIKEQLYINNINYIDKLFKYVFTYNGLSCYKNNESIYENNNYRLSDKQLSKLNNLLVPGSLIDIKKCYIYLLNLPREQTIQLLQKEFPKLYFTPKGNMTIHIYSKKNMNRIMEHLDEYDKIYFFGDDAFLNVSSYQTTNSNQTCKLLDFFIYI